MVTLLAVIGLVALVLMSLAGIVWILGTFDVVSYFLFGGQAAVEALGHAIVFLLQVLVAVISGGEK